MSENAPKGRRTSLVAAIVVIALLIVVLAGGGLWLLLNRDAGPSSEPSGSASTPPLTPATSGTTEGKCDAPKGDMTDVPSDLAWSASQGVTWPTSPSLGPTSTEDGFGTCFSQSPIGAALAAVTSMYAAVDHDARDTVRFYVVDSIGKTKVLAQTDTPKPLSEQLASAGMTLVGFQVAEYQPDRATIRLVFSVPNSPTGYRTIPRTLVWVDGDWRVRLLDNGSTGEATDANAGQFVSWSDHG